jgi:polyisoprenoid-binding protein YceI
MSDLSALTPGTWNVDPMHSTVGFTVRHLMITKVHGTFKEFTGSITVGDDPTKSSVEATVQMASVHTGDEGRDGHLRTGDFFEVEQFPTMTFRSTGITAKGGDYAMAGDLTIKGVTKPVVFDLEFEGVNKDPWGNTKAGFTATTEINRKDWGLEYNAVLESGGVVISEKVKLNLDIQAVKS